MSPHNRVINQQNTKKKKKQRGNKNPENKNQREKKRKKKRNQERQKISQRSLVHPHQSSAPPDQPEKASPLVSPLITPGKPFVSPCFHFNYLVFVASVHEQFMHAY